MTHRQFKDEFEPLIPSPRNQTTRSWLRFARECTRAGGEPQADYLEELIRTFTFIRRNFPTNVVQELYQTIEDSGALLNSELFWGAMYLQSGGTRRGAGALAAEGAFEIGMELPEIPEQPDVRSNLSIFVLNTGGKTSFYLTGQYPEHPELLADAVRQGASSLSISHMEAFDRLKRNLTFRSRQNTDACRSEMAFCGVSKQIATMVGHNFLKGFAVASLVNFDGSSGKFTVRLNQRWLRAAQEHYPDEGLAPPQF